MSRDGAACDLDLREDSEIVTNNELDAISYSIELSIVTSTRYFDRININSYHCVCEEEVEEEHTYTIMEWLPRSQVKANWIALLPTPQKASTMRSH